MEVRFQSSRLQLAERQLLNMTGAGLRNWMKMTKCYRLR